MWDDLVASSYRQRETNQPTNMKKYRFEILDDMESTVALADTLEDAMYAAELHNAKLIYDNKNRKCISFK